MFAVIRTGGKQYVVEPGKMLDVERLSGEPGDSVQFMDVLLVSHENGISIGQPVVEGYAVPAVIVEQKRGPKLTIFKKLRRHGKRLKKGHRQDLTRVRIGEFETSGSQSA